jgi:copper chaperone CopZ
VEAALLKVTGVKKAKIGKKDGSKGTVNVTYDARKTSLYTIVKTFNEKNGDGYKVALAKS